MWVTKRDLFLPHDKLVVVASMMPEAAAVASRGYNTPVFSRAVVVFLVARASPTTVDP
jgi:hypothetical protein